MKTDDLIEDIQHLIRQYNLDSESIDEIKWMSERKEEVINKIEFFKARIGGCETLIKVYDAAMNEILNTTKNKER